MDRTTKHVSGSSKRLRNVVMSISTVASLCAKKAIRVSKKLKAKPMTNNNDGVIMPLRAKKLLTSISNKAITYLNKKKVNGKEINEDEFGDGGVWQRAILMGDKCQPLDFSGVIYYDSNGTQLSEVPPRSPRASPLPGYLARK